MKSTHIKAFITNKKDRKEIENSKKQKIRYKERAFGKFDNSIKDQELHKIIEEIRLQIRKNKTDEFN
ncbi:MAG: hypothetical protein QM482_04855 [Sulfurospirillum sp.]